MWKAHKLKKIVNHWFNDFYKTFIVLYIGFISTPFIKDLNLIYRFKLLLKFSGHEWCQNFRSLQFIMPTWLLIILSTLLQIFPVLHPDYINNLKIPQNNLLFIFSLCLGFQTNELHISTYWPGPAAVHCRGMWKIFQNIIWSIRR